MIKVGDFTVIQGTTYYITRIEDNFAYMLDVAKMKGRPKKVILSQVPYFVDDKLITPVQENTKIPSRKLVSKVNIRAIANETTEMQVSKNAIMWIHEQLEGICEILLSQAEEKAKYHQSKRIEPRHIQHIRVPESAEDFVFLSHDDYIKDGI